MPIDEPKVWQIVFTHSDGTQTLGDQIEWPSRGHRRETKTTPRRRWARWRIVTPREKGHVEFVFPRDYR